jgi:hypothetical protein
MSERRLGLMPGPLLVAALTLPLAAQAPPEIRLGRAEARIAHPLSSITGFRALPDGRVLVSDGIDEVLLRFDAQLLRADTISRAGQGPGEYKSPDALFAVESGGTLLVDLGNGRLSFFDAAGKYKESTPVARGTPGAGPGPGGGLTMVVPRGTDARGRIYFQPGQRPDGGRADSAAVVRWDRSRDVMDTVARVGLPEVRVNASGGSNNRSVMMRPVPLAPQDTWGVGPDGRFALVRAAGYRLEWVMPDGRVVRGPANEYRPVPVRDAEKQEWLEQMANGLGIMVTNENGRMSIRMSRGGPRQGPPPSASDFEWPAAKPPFAGGVWVTPAGEAWVERSVPAGAPRVYDVFGPQATITRRVVLPAGRRLLAIGSGVVYAQHTDPDGLQYLERYRLP